MAKQIKAKKQTATEHKESTIESVGTRGRVFEGYIIKKFPHRAVIEYEATVYVKKYERFYKKKSKLHARIPAEMQVKVGDYVRIKECRQLSKIINHMVIEKVRSKETQGDKK